MQGITPFLWFDTQAEEATNFYTSIFKNSKKISESCYGDSGPGAKGSIMTTTFELEGQRFIALNAGPHFKFNESVSFMVNCETQAEVDYYTEKLLAGGGVESACGWLKDKFGLSWQITPVILMKLIADPDKAKADRVMKAMMQMKKIIIADLEKAANAK